MAIYGESSYKTMKYFRAFLQGDKNMQIFVLCVLNNDEVIFANKSVKEMLRI